MATKITPFQPSLLSLSRPGQDKEKQLGMKFKLHADNERRFIQHPQQGQVEVVALYCNCGRCIMVTPEMAQAEPVICSACHSPFHWHQLCFDLAA